jgi:hypothetical protein
MYIDYRQRGLVEFFFKCPPHVTTGAYQGFFLKGEPPLGKSVLRERDHYLQSRNIDLQMGVNFLQIQLSVLV